jgi:hypothetical protein
MLDAFAIACPNPAVGVVYAVAGTNPGHDVPAWKFSVGADTNPGRESGDIPALPINLVPRTYAEDDQ